MQLKFMTKIFARVLIAGFGVLTLTTGAASVSAAEGDLSLLLYKDCSTNKGTAGSFCQITSSNVAAIAVGSKLFYDQAFGLPTCSNPDTISPPCPQTLIDSNVLLYVETGTWAHGRCTYEVESGFSGGLCDFSDGKGKLAGFYAYGNVSPSPPGVGNCVSKKCYRVKGTYILGSGEQQE